MTTGIWPPTLVPSDRPRRPGGAAGPTAVETTGLPGVDTADELVLAAAFAALLYRYTGQERIALAVPDGELRFTVSGDSSVRLAATTSTAADARAESVAVGFALADESDGDDPGPVELRLVVRGGTAELLYDTELFDRDTARRMLEHYRILVADASERPDCPVRELRLLSAQELETSLVEWNRTGTDLPNSGCLHEAFEARVEQSPEAIAVVHGGRRLTYRQINTEANRLAHHLRSFGVGPDVRVGLCLDRSAELLVAELAVLKAGGAYVPLDPDYPAERIAVMAAGTSCAVMVSREDLTGNLPVSDGASPPLVLLDRDAALLAKAPGHNPAHVASPEHLCYIIHTSGSTGAPKPIALRHRGVLNNIADLNTRYEVGAGDSVLALSSPSFDMSVYEFLGLTLAGGTVVVPDAGRTKDPAHWAELLVRENVTVWNSAPALLGLLTEHLELSGAEPLPLLRLALLGGDWVPVTLPDRVRALAPALRFVVMGGATESSIHSTLFEVDKVDPEWTSIPYGRPMANQRTYILDDHLQPVPVGVPGELYLAGTGLARGYLDQPERTAERFTHWSYGDLVRDERLYRTGDVARYRLDGMIELVGRKDFQVKIHGLRVELGEVETVLRVHPQVRQSVVVARDNRLIAYVVPEQDAGVLDPEELLAHAALRLPEYMVPAAVVVLERLPLTPNGKLDRMGLPDPSPAPGTLTPYREPDSEQERVLAEVWAEVLGVERVGADDDFLGLGGGSIRAIMIATRARARGLEITPAQVFKCRTVAALATAAVAASPSTASVHRGPLTDPSSARFLAFKEQWPGLEDVWPLTALQSGILFESARADGDHDAYQMQNVFRVSGTVDPARMRVAGQALLARHASLRTAFVPDDQDGLAQLVLADVALPWRELDLSASAPAERDDALQRFLAEDYAARFDRAAPPMLRLTLVRLGEREHVLVLTTHHVLIDGWSEPILLLELLQLYAADGDAGALPAAGSFGGFLAWLRDQDREAAARAWAEELDGVLDPTLLAPEQAVPVEGQGAGTVAVDLSDEESQLLSRCARELGVTPSTVVQGCWGVLLGALTGREDVTFGAAVSGRPAALTGVESTVGLFINTVPVRVRCGPEETFASVLTRLQERQSVLMDHHHHSLPEIQESLGLDALFDTLVAFQSYPVDRAGIARASAAAGLEVAQVRAEGAANYPLALLVETDPERVGAPGSGTGSGLRLTLQYHRDVYRHEAVVTLAERLQQVLLRLLASPGGRLAALDLLLEREHGPSGATGAGTAADVDRTTDELVEWHAARTPGAPAVNSGGRALTYAELTAWAARLAERLMSAGVGPGSVVALTMARSPQLAVALLAVLRTGAAFVRPAADGSIADTAVQRISAEDVDRYAEHLGTAAGRDGTAAFDPGHAAWVRPGQDGDTGAGTLAVSHHALATTVQAFAAAAGLTPGYRLLAASPDDDGMLVDLLAGLSSGATVDLPANPADAVRDWTGDVVSTTTACAAVLPGHRGSALRAHTVVLSGASVPQSLVHLVRDAAGGARVVVVHRQLEAAFVSWVTAGALSGPLVGLLPLGTPAAGMRAQVLDGALRPVPPGTLGELYLAGTPSHGFLGQPGRTAGCFVADPSGPPGSRMYRTGSMARRSEDGGLEFAGPAGPRPRVRGRELPAGHLERVGAVLAGHPGVARAAAVVLSDSGPHEARIVGYAAPLGDALPSVAELTAFAARHLPEHLAPACVVVLPELPCGADGRVDHAALPAPEAVSGGGSRRPRTPQEEAVCALVADVLGVEEIGIDDNFFGRGCNSMKATRITGRMRRSLGIDVSIRVLFEHPTVAEMSEHFAPATARSRPGLGAMLKARAGLDPDRPTTERQRIRTEMKEQVTRMRREAKAQAKELKEQLTAEAREEWSPENVAAQTQERIRRSMEKHSTTPPKAGKKDGKE
ncbi:hypothetical protein DN069_13995 [Streptacidiphilus pinicola]|uniref:Carrier domain-containing protein n=1 Tax=Streptacidiphilus pinicola TaxID=2219663 RepID=A0A2X0K719_9ACTN|nr:non-ribosomal peptide synthetase [Streptacidiphilus pinicola]RAG85065.1 hypothetical protein DN069_13995 [Streptacidiphilus pinicola]